MSLFEQTISFNNSLVERHGDLLYYATKAIDESSMSVKAYGNAKQVLLDLIRISCAIIETVRTGDKNGGNSCEKGGDKSVDAKQYHEPKHISTKGHAKRLKYSKEKALKKARLCRGCYRRGVSHDRRNCPTLLNRVIAQESANSQGTAGGDSCFFDQDNASLNTSSNDESEATFWLV